jgi:hypothetical protein
MEMERQFALLTNPLRQSRTIQLKAEAGESVCVATPFSNAFVELSAGEFDKVTVIV